MTLLVRVSNCGFSITSLRAIAEADAVSASIDNVIALMGFLRFILACVEGGFYLMHDATYMALAERMIVRMNMQSIFLDFLTGILEKLVIPTMSNALASMPVIDIAPMPSHNGIMVDFMLAEAWISNEARNSIVV